MISDTTGEPEKLTPESVLSGEGVNAAQATIRLAAGNPDYLCVNARMTILDSEYMHIYRHAWQRKTISIDIEADERLRRARRAPTESFSRVIKHAEWPVPPRTAGALLSAIAKFVPVEEEIIERLNAARTLDRPPKDPWRDDCASTPRFSSICSANVGQTSRAQRTPYWLKTSRSSCFFRRPRSGSSPKGSKTLTTRFCD